MSTSPVQFDLGQSASASRFMGALESLWNQGQSVLEDLGNYRTTSLVDFEQKIEALNGRRQRAGRINPAYTSVKFVVTDFLDIDQTLTSATVRADAQAVTLKERASATNALLRGQTFSTSDGTAEAISPDQTLYRVQTLDGTVPVGTFSLELVEQLEMSVLTFDLAAMPPTPGFVVSASQDGTTYTPATQTSLNGYRLTAWFPPMEMRYITLAITPAAPDTLGGTSYTFGLTDFVGSETEFQLISELVTLPVDFQPVGARLKLNAPELPGVLYFLSFDEGAWQEYAAGAEVPVPGTTTISLTGVTVTVGAGLSIGSAVLPSTAYTASVRIVDQAGNHAVRIAPHLSGVTSGAAILTRDYVGVTPGALLNYVAASTTVNPSSKVFSLSYVMGPASMSVRLKVQLTTSDRTLTPAFNGASLEEL